MTWLDKLFRSGGYEAIALTGDKTLDSDLALAAKVIRFTGTLSTTATIKFPAESGADWVVINDCTTSITLTAGSGSTVEIASSTVRVVAVTDSGMVAVDGGDDGAPTVVWGEGDPNGLGIGGLPGQIYVDTAAASSSDPDRVLYVHIGGGWLSLTPGATMVYPLSSEPTLTLAGAYHDQVVVVSYAGEPTLTLPESPRAGDRVTIIASDAVDPGVNVVWDEETIHYIEPGSSIVVVYDGTSWHVESSAGESIKGSRIQDESITPDRLVRAHAHAMFDGAHDTSSSTVVQVTAAGPTPVNVGIESGQLTVTHAGVYSVRVTGDVQYGGDAVTATIRVNGVDVRSCSIEAFDFRSAIALEALVDCASADVIDVTVSADASATISGLRLDVVAQLIG